MVRFIMNIPAANKGSFVLLTVQYCKIFVCDVTLRWMSTVNDARCTN